MVGDHEGNRRKPMAKLKTLSAVIILSAAVATPVFAQDADVTKPAPTHHVRAHDRSNYRGAYNAYNQPNADVEDFGFSGRDPSRPGGEDPNLRPSGS
jgi:hypothetical protein